MISIDYRVVLVLFRNGQAGGCLGFFDAGTCTPLRSFLIGVSPFFFFLLFCAALSCDARFKA